MYMAGLRTKTSSATTHATTGRGPHLSTCAGHATVFQVVADLRLLCDKDIAWLASAYQNVAHFYSNLQLARCSCTAVVYQGRLAQ